MTTYAATHNALIAHRPPARAFRRLVGFQVRRAWREPTGMLLGLGLPIFVLVAFGLVPATKVPAFTDARFTMFEYYVPVLICLAVSLIALISLPPPFVSDRENRWLRRISTTPAPPSWLLASQTVVYAVLAVLAVVVLTVGSIAFFDVMAPANVLGYVLAALLLITAMFALGLLVTAVSRTSAIASGLTYALFLPLGFFGGLFLPLHIMPPALQTIGGYTPLGAAGNAMRDAMLGSFPSTTSLLVLVGWTVVSGLAAVRSFRWE